MELSNETKNADLLAKWLNNAKFYISNYRAVPIEEHLVFENAVYPASSSNRFYKTASQLNSQVGGNSTEPLPAPHRRIQTSQHKELTNPVLNSVIALANETARSGYGVLVFCSSRFTYFIDFVSIWLQLMPSSSLVFFSLLFEYADSVFLSSFSTLI